MKTAVIMAAGMGTRFGKYTEIIPKGFVEFKGKGMVVRSVDTLIECGIERIIIGTGYHKEKYEALAAEINSKHAGKVKAECIFSPRFAETNSMYTLYNCREAIGNHDFLLLESDLVYERRAIQDLIDCRYESAMLIAPVTKFQDQYYVEMNSRCELTDCSTDKTQINPSGELVGIHKLSNGFYKTCVEEYAKIVDEKPKLGYEYMLLGVSQRITPMNVLKIEGLQWYEIDDEADLTYAEAHVLID